MLVLSNVASVANYGSEGVPSTGIVITALVIMIFGAEDCLLTTLKLTSLFVKMMQGHKVVDCEWAEPLTDTEEDKIVAARRVDFQLGWYLDPIYFGEYPKSMHERLGNLLPKFSGKDKDTLRTSLDLNHYTSRFMSHYTNQDQNDYYRTQEATMIELERLVGGKMGSSNGLGNGSKGEANQRQTLSGKKLNEPKPGIWNCWLEVKITM
nr:beta-glucosidase 42-like [Tanacetum cinerariifolium]